jgi:hypothetical protein
MSLFYQKERTSIYIYSIIDILEDHMINIIFDTGTVNKLSYCDSWTWEQVNL